MEGPTPSADPQPEFDELQLQEEQIDTALPELGSFGMHGKDSRTDRDDSSDSDMSENIVVARPSLPTSAQPSDSRPGLRRSGRTVIRTLKAREGRESETGHQTNLANCPRKTFFALTAAINATSVAKLGHMD